MRLGGRRREGRRAPLAAGSCLSTRAEEGVGGLGGRERRGALPATCSVGGIEPTNWMPASRPLARGPENWGKTARAGAGERAPISEAQLVGSAPAFPRGAPHFQLGLEIAPREAVAGALKTLCGNWARQADDARNAAAGAGHWARFCRGQRCRPRAAPRREPCCSRLHSVSLPSAEREWDPGPRQELSADGGPGPWLRGGKGPKAGPLAAERPVLPLTVVRYLKICF